MLRIIAGQFKGRKLISPAGRDTRPTADIVKEAIFSMLENLPFDLNGAIVLDFFAGSGALAFEALSRGASLAVLADDDKTAADAVIRNIEALGPEATAVFIRTRWPHGFGKLNAHGPFNLLFLDPPYKERHLPILLLQKVAELGLVTEGAVAVWERAPEAASDSGEAEVGPWRIVKAREWKHQAAVFLKYCPAG